MKICAICVDECQFAKDIGMPEFRCVNDCQYDRYRRHIESNLRDVESHNAHFELNQSGGDQ